ncbi:hypothetical protein BH24ACT4_BH24ACT4_25470 [soil metagenome]
MSGGGQLVSRYEVTVAVVDEDGDAYAEVTARVVPSDDRARPAAFEASAPLTADEVRVGSDCEVEEAEPLRIAPR